jgi:hypothetical protein
MEMRILAALDVVTNAGRSPISKAIKTFLSELKGAAEQINYWFEVRLP